jgi:succinate dehydrogenase/fumarate reductase cytochrome b subunit
MKITGVLLATFFIVFSLQAAHTPPPALPKEVHNAHFIMIPMGDGNPFISLYTLATISVDQMESRTGKKMKWVEKMAFKSAQRKLKRSIAEDGTISSKKLRKHAAMIDGETGFHIGGFALGFLIGLIGVLIAYLIRDEKKSNRTKWAWIGFGTWVVIALLFII